jgi:hypothetical protein
MDNRPNLQTLLKQFCNNVYFQPPESLKLNYPAIVYKRSDIRNTFADDEVYKQSFQYELTVIDKNPDSEIVNKVSKLPKVRFNRHFQSDNLNHDVFTIYYK